MSSSKTIRVSSGLSARDLVPDEPLHAVGKESISDDADLLHHRVIARKVAELATSSNGMVNIALFGPWGSGKSSFNGLLGEELRALQPKTRHVTFDAWKNAGEGFRTNFLSELAKQIPNADQKISDELFEATTRVELPFTGPLARVKGGLARAALIAAFLLVLFIGAPLVWTIVANLMSPADDFLGRWWANITGFAGIAVSSTLLLVVSAGVIELSKVTVAKSTPSHVAQFSNLFEKLLKKHGDSRYVIFIDELDRCGETDVMATLEGLRTFLGHKQCVFVVAFDRDAVASTIAKHIKHSTPQEASSYYQTSGEYLDKIFQFQLALPPQPAHTFRRFALSLVNGREGVWGELSNHEDGLLERVVTILSPMHLASPRRTKVLLNDFAVNARIFESLGFAWLDRAGEIAVLTVLQTEFPNLMADIERTPSLMRFLYRDETPSRPELKSTLAKYDLGDAQDVAPDGAALGTNLDQVVKGADAQAVAHDLRLNLARYLRRLREMAVPEPKADLIMMHSDGDLLHFDDPDMYHHVLLAADTPRQDVVEAFATATALDRALAIEHVLEQAERESADIARSLRILAGELAVGLPSMTSRLAAGLQAGMSAGLQGYSQASIEGYTRAVAAEFSGDAYSRLIGASKDSTATLGAVVSRLTEELPPAHWLEVRFPLLSRVLPLAVSLSEVLTQLLRRMGLDDEVELGREKTAVLTKALSISAPEKVEPETATAAAQKEADETNADAMEEFEADRANLRAAVERILEVWPHLPAGGGMRRSVLTVLRGAEDGTSWHLERHDELIKEEMESGDVAAGNSHLLQAIAAKPWLGASRWRGLLSEDVPVEVEEKAEALRAVIGRATSRTDVASQANGASNALKIARLPSGPVPAGELLAKVADDVSQLWDEYSDNRFEYQIALLDAIDALEDPDIDTTPVRVQLVVDAVTVAQAEDANVGEISKAVRRVQPEVAAFIANGLQEANAWSAGEPEASVRVFLEAHEIAYAHGGPLETIPASAMKLLSASTLAQLAPAWLQTGPDQSEVEELLEIVTFPPASWQRYGERVEMAERAEMWRTLVDRGASVSVLTALSRPGMALDVYVDAAAVVRDANVVRLREPALDRFLSLPASEEAAGVARGLLGGMAGEMKATELPLGVRLARAYAPHWPARVRTALKPRMTSWAEAAQGRVPRRDVNWLADSGFISRKSPLWEQLLPQKRRK